MVKAQEDGILATGSSAQGWQAGSAESGILSKLRSCSGNSFRCPCWDVAVALGRLALEVHSCQMVPEANHERRPVLLRALHIEVIHVRPHATWAMGSSGGFTESVDCFAEAQRKAWACLTTSLDKGHPAP